MRRIEDVYRGVSETVQPRNIDKTGDALFQTLTGSKCYSASTNELANPPKKGTSKRSSPSAIWGQRLQCL